MKYLTVEAILASGKNQIEAHVERRQIRRRLFSRRHLSQYPALAELVLARNITNTEEINKFLSDLHAEDMPPINEWLDTTMRKFLINRYDKVKHYTPKDSDPDWMKGKTDLESVVLDDALIQKVQHIVDFLKNKLTAEPNFNLNSFQAEEAFKQSQAWTDKLLKKKSEAEEEGVDYKVLLDLGGGWRWLNLLSENSLVREGKLMGHCVGGYFARVKSGAEMIFSLRDPKNEPHATIEYLPRRAMIQQIKGKQNKELVNEYVPYLLTLLQKSPVPIKKIDDYDLGRNGLIKAEQGFLSLKNLPEGTILTQDLDMSSMSGINLPKNLTIKGNMKVGDDVRLAPGLTVSGELSLKKSNISWLPRGLSVGSLNIFGCGNLKELPKDISVKKNLNAEFTALKNIPPGLKVSGDLTLSDTDISEIPSGIKVGGELDLMNTQVKKLPKDLKVGKAIFVNEPDEVEVPDKLKDKVH